MQPERMTQLLATPSVAVTDPTLVFMAHTLGNMSAADRDLLARGLQECISAHQAAGRTVIGGAFAPHPVTGWLGGVRALIVAAVGPWGEGQDGPCYVRFTLPEATVSEPVDVSQCPERYWELFGLDGELRRYQAEHPAAARS